MKLIVNVLMFCLMPLFVFAQPATGFQDAIITRGMPDAPRAFTGCDALVLNAARIDRDALRAWLTNFTADSVIAYAGPGVKFAVEMHDGFALIKAGASARIQGVRTVLGQAINASPHLVLPIGFGGDTPLVPKIDRSSRELYVIRGTCVIQAKGRDPGILPVETATHEALKYLIQALAKQDGVVRKSGFVYLLRHSVVSVESDVVLIDVEIAVDFK